MIQWYWWDLLVHLVICLLLGWELRIMHPHPASIYLFGSDLPRTTNYNIRFRSRTCSPLYSLLYPTRTTTSTLIMRAEDWELLLLASSILLENHGWGATLWRRSRTRSSQQGIGMINDADGTWKGFLRFLAGKKNAPIIISLVLRWNMDHCEEGVLDYYKIY